MMGFEKYKKAFYYALGLHLFLLFMLVGESASKRPVLTVESKNTPGVQQAVAAPEQEIVKAVSVDSKEIADTVNKLKQEREQKQRAEVSRQQELNRQAQAAKQQRIKEQQQLAKLKEEANKIAILRKKQIEEEKKHLKELAEQKVKEAKRIEELKKQQEDLVKRKELEEKKLTELNHKKALERAKAEQQHKEQDLAKAEQARAEKAQADAKAKAELARKQQAQEAAAAQNAENQARIAGEVDKYKALIVNAIGRNWILPEHVDSNMSSQFRIRLAPDGAVLDVQLTRSSGDPLLDRSAQTAIYKASPLPVPSDSQTFNLFRDISLTVRPEQVRG